MRSEKSEKVKNNQKNDSQSKKKSTKTGNNVRITHSRTKDKQTGPSHSPYKDIKGMEQNQQIEQKGNDFISFVPNIPKIVQYEHKSNTLVQNNISYFDLGRQKWKIGRIIGKGNSSVRKAMNIKTGTISAVKQLTFSSQQQQKIKIKQTEILKTLNHPNVVSYLQHYKDKNSILVFMEYVPTNLKNFYNDFGPPPAEVFLKLARQIVEALAYLHKNNIMHKDIKCENILLDNEGIVKLCDFGQSKNFRNTLSLKNYQQDQAVKSFKGTVRWTAPQNLLGKPCLASDIWSLGCSFVQLASGKLPWHQKNFDNPCFAIRYIAQNDQTPQINQEWDSRIKQMISCCLKRDPCMRITASQLLKRQELWK